MNLANFKFDYNHVIVKWETPMARFLQIEFSPSHILRVRIDKEKNKKGGEPV